MPSLDSVAPRYLKVVTSSNFWPFMLISALMLFVLLVMIVLFSGLTSIPYALALCLQVCWCGLEVHHCCCPWDWCRWRIVGCILVCHQWRWMCGGHGAFHALSVLGTSWTGWVRVSIPDRHLLLAWRTPLADSLRGLCCCSSHTVSALNQSSFTWKLLRTCHCSVCQTLSNAFL